MKKFAKGIVKCRVMILILAVALLIPSAIGYFNTRINYDVLTYLPKDIETMVGQDILLDQFGVGKLFHVYCGRDGRQGCLCFESENRAG